MSKFFDETVRARNSTAASQPFNLGGLPKLLGTPELTPAPGSDLGQSRLETARKDRIALSMFLSNRFKGSDMLGPAEESYRALRTRLLRLKSSQGLRSIVITSATAAEGKTLTALNLAICCAQLHDMRVLLLDADIRRGGLSKVLALPATPGLAEVISGRVEPSNAILGTDLPNLYVLGSGASQIAPAELFAHGRWREFMGWCNESFKLIIVDATPVMHLSDSELIVAACDGVVLVVRAQFTKRDILQRAASQIDPKKLLGVVYNAIDHGGHDQYDYPSYSASSKQKQG